MATSLVIAPVEPGRAEWWRRLAEHLRTDQAPRRAEWQRRHDLSRITVWVTPKDQVLLLTEGRELIEVLHRMTTSEDDFDQWLCSWLRQLVGGDPVDWAVDHGVEAVLDTKPDGAGWRGWPR
ncbi:MAG: hypothetical protein KDB21_17415 [Acidimicrobiales bacterium]|nr:hypothetical protein [Acidimicrobiales bacterium]